MRSKSSFFVTFFILVPLLFSHSSLAQETPVTPTDPGAKPPPPKATPANAPIEVPSLSQTSAPSGVEVGTQGNTGAASAGIPIEVPPGRRGVAPNLALVYNSNMGNGIEGVGWDIGLGEIQRSTKRGVNYAGNGISNGTSDFVFVLNGSSSELVPRSDWGANYFGEKIERTFSEYYFDPNGGWTVTTKDGTKYYYGTTSASRQENAFGIFKWCLDRVQDSNGNYMTVTYVKDQGAIGIDRIDYTGNSGLSPTNHLQFYYEPRTDAPPMYTTNSRVRTAYRLQSIEVYGNGQLARRYVLNYSYSVSSSRSLLASVTLYGDDGTPFPRSTIFSYQQSATGFGQEYMSGVVDWGRDHGRQWADFNGDGKADFCRVTGSGGEVRCTLSTGNGFVGTEYSAYLDSGNDNMGRQWIDFDGDGKSDFCRLVNGYGQCTVSTGTGFGSTYASASGGIFYGEFPQWADFNGDGRADLCGYNSYIGAARCTVSAGTGFGATYTQDPPSNLYPWTSGQWVDFNGDGRADFCLGGESCTVSTGTGFGETYPVPFGGEGTVTMHWVDFNGDGKTDSCRTLDGSVECMLSTGTGFGETIYSGPIDTGQIAGRQFIDVNGDGKADYCRVIGSANLSSSYVSCLISKGDGFGPEIVSGVIDWGHDAGRQWTDFNGDGKADYCRLVGDANAGLTYVKCSTALSPGNAAIDDLLIGVTNSFGGATTVNYTPSSAYQNGYLPFIVPTVSSISINDGNGTVSTTNYTYSGGSYNADEREFRGFGYVRATDLTGTTTETWFNQDDIFKGLPIGQAVCASSGYCYNGTLNTYQSSSYSGVTFPYLSQKDDYVCDGTATLQQILDGTVTCKQASTIFFYDSYGNVSRKYSYGDVAIQGDERDEWTEYYYDTTKWILSLPAHTWANNSAGVKQAEAWFDYDTNGNLLTKTLGLVLGQKNNAQNPKISYTYEYGNVRTVTDARGYTATTDYDSTYTYPARVTNYLGHYIQKTYDYKYGKPLTETDPNGNTTTYGYDPFGRIKTITTQDDAAPAYAWKETSYDGLGRTIRTRTGGPDGKVIAQQTVYDQRGLVSYASLPYFESIEGQRWTHYEYDPVGRVTRITNPDGTSASKTYMQGRLTLTDANGHKKVEEKDVYGRLRKVEEYTGTATTGFNLYATTFYDYDVLGNLTTVRDTLQNTTTIGYDTLSRKRWMTDPDMGYWTYDYDANGNLISQTDAKGQTIQFQYDAINRIYNKHYVNCTTCTDVIYTYDDPAVSYSKGRLTSVTDSSGGERYYYDRMGRTVQTIKTVDGISYAVDTTYDELGRVVSIRYPDNETVGYDYDSGGNLTGAGNYATYGGFNALGQAGSINYGNGVSTTLQYYSSNNRLYSITTNSPTQGGIQNLAYIFDNVGNISRITDLLDGNRTQNFTYDDLNRLAQAQSASYANGTITYQYNQIGNMTYNSRVGSYTYGTKPHAALQAGANTYQYDANGNMSVRNGITITYDYDNRVTNIGSVTSVYDYAGHRVKKNGTVYIGKLYECNGSSCTKYIFAGSSRIASKSSSNTFYYHTDHLDSSTVITNALGNREQETYYYPFGETRYNSGNATHYKFTGQEEDAETGLYYYGARYYDPVIGRFISADSIVQDPFDPQTLNRYSYVINNPLKYVDPDGHFFLELLIASMVIGAVTSGIQSHWNIGEMARGAVMAGATAGLMAGIGATVSAAIQASLYANASQFSMYTSNTLELNMVFENTYSISAGIFSPGIERAAAAGMFFGGIAGGIGGGIAAGASSGSSFGGYGGSNTSGRADWLQYDAKGRMIGEIGIEASPTDPSDFIPLFGIGGVIKNVGKIGLHGITGFTKHGLNQAISREGVGVSSKAMLDAVKNSLKVTAVQDNLKS